MEIDIDKYLSEEDKIEIAKDVFRGKISSLLAKESDIGRTIGNVVFQIIQGEVQKNIPDFVEKIRSNVTSTINKKDLSFYVFYDGAYGNKSLGYSILEDSVIEHKELIKTNVINAINGLDYKRIILDKILTDAESFIGNVYDFVQHIREGKNDN